ncbi:MAG TPA: DNA polymerase ligase N-terminal domain-containing protein [Alphaproteobacteria bacterium]|nr:DNA polymerase ligase N-terminal domain-containing protein [Alphaproteobacteria bacterium]
MARSGGKTRTDRLSRYHEKRHFDRTPEPKGQAGRRGGKKRGGAYAIQLHAATRLHYDLRLEHDGVLLSWAVTRGPSLDPSEKRLAMRTEDHPLDYAEFEGRIPKGNYGAGTVLLWDRGRWEPEGDPGDGLKRGKLSFRLDGERLRGGWALVRFRGSKSDRRETWLLIKERDAEADRRCEITAEYEVSVASGRSIEEIADDTAPEHGDEDD